MDNAEFLGMFRLRNKKRPEAMPAHNESGLWQAWEMPDGNLMVQALGWDHEPWGSYYLMPQENFFTLLASLSSSAPADGEDAPSLVQSDAPDLLSLWYEQALAERTEDAAPDRMAAPQPASELTMTAPRASVAADEYLLSPVEHPDDLFFDDPMFHALPQTDDSGGAPAPLVHDGPVLQATTERAYAVIPPPSQATAAGFVPAAGPAPAGGLILDIESLASGPEPAPPPAPAPKHSLALELQAKRMEDYMREEFSDMLDRLSDTPDPELDEALARLVSKGASFSWKQKFMFTDFGRALRRKNRPQLALLCHLRALHYAPNDEHVLFNVARAEYELGNIEAAKNNLEKALVVQPDFTAAADFLLFLRGTRKKNNGRNE